MNQAANATVELDDIQSRVLRPRPNPYAAAYLLFRIDDARSGRELLGRIAAVVASAAHPSSPAADADTWVSIALTHCGLRVLGLPQRSLASFAWELRQGMAARARALGDVGESAPERWERPLGTPEVHVVLTAVSPDRARLESALARARRLRVHSGNREHLAAGVPRALHRQGALRLPRRHQPPGSRGERHPRDQPPRAAAQGRRVRARLPDETGSLPPMPWPDLLGRNGTYVAFRKLHPRVAAFRRYLAANATTPDEQERLAAEMMGRWRSGAPLARCPPHEDPALGADSVRNNDFLYGDDPIGYSTPPGSHVRRTNPRDEQVAGVVRLHRMIRRGTAYGPELPEGVLEDDGAERGLMFAFVGSHLGRQSSSCNRSGSTADRSSASATTRRIPSPARTTGRARSSSRRGPFRGASKGSLASSSCAAGSTPSCPACGRSVGSQNWGRDVLRRQSRCC